MHLLYHECTPTETRHVHLKNIVILALGSDSPLSAYCHEHYGEAARRIANDATAFRHRDLPWDIVIAAQWTDIGQTEAQREWARATDRAIRPFSGGRLLSTIDVEPDDIVRTAFGANLPRLAGVKARYDPDNFFRVNQNIRRAADAAAQGAAG